MNDHGDILRGLGRLEGKVDELTNTMATTQKARVSHDVRLRSLERFRGFLGGAAAVVGSVLTYLKINGGLH